MKLPRYQDFIDELAAGNSSQTSDGAAGVVVMSRARADELRLKPLARFVSIWSVVYRWRSWEWGR